MSATGRTAYAVLLSGFGSNLQALIDAAERGELNSPPSLIIADRPNAQGLVRGKAAGIQTRFMSPAEHSTRAGYGLALQSALTDAGIDYVVLAGFMRILADEFVVPWGGRIVNIHPSLLPRYPGLNTHRRAIESGDTQHGSTVHFVVPELDAGPRIAQFRLNIRREDTAETLKQRVQAGEHEMYPKVVQWLLEGRVELRDGHTILDGKRLTEPVTFPG